MARNGSGTYSLPSGNPVVTGATISSTDHNNTMNDIATALTASIAKDGQTTPTANLPMGTYKHTGVANASNLTDYASADQVMNGNLTLLSSVSGSDTITASAAITPAAYEAGQNFVFVSAGANTGAATLNVSSLGAKAITKNGTTALAAGDIPSGAVAHVVYDGTQFQLLNIYVNMALYSTLAGANAFTGANTFAAEQTFNHLVTMEKGADIASATTVDLTAATGNLVHITGTTTTTGFTMNTGQQMELVADGAWPLTYNATTCKINGGADYTCAAGDRLFVFDDGTVTYVNVIKQDGTAVVATSGLPSPDFTSSLTALRTATGVTSIAHGLGAVPTLFTVYAECIAAGGADGFALGDRILLSNNQGGGTDLTTSADTTNIYVATLGATQALDIATPAWVTLSATNWSYRALAWA